MLRLDIGEVCTTKNGVTYMLVDIAGYDYALMDVETHAVYSAKQAQEIYSFNRSSNLDVWIKNNRDEEIVETTETSAFVIGRAYAVKSVEELSKIGIVTKNKIYNPAGRHPFMLGCMDHLCDKIFVPKHLTSTGAYHASNGWLIYPWMCRESFTVEDK